MQTAAREFDQGYSTKFSILFLSTKVLYSMYCTIVDEQIIYQ
jgi:hypothetical protein